MNRLPVPDDGWRRLVQRATAIAVLWAIATFSIAVAAMPVIDPECYSDTDGGGQVCPLHRDPALTHLFDVRWPPVPAAVTVSVILVAILLGIGLAILLDTSEPWSEQGGAPTAAGGIAGLLGAGLGLLVAGPGFFHPLIALGTIVLGALLFLLGLLGLRAFRRALHRRYARHLRREHLRDHGTRIVATITEVTWEETYPDGDALFTVTAAFTTATGARLVIETILVPRADAPVVDGTVVIFHDDERAHPTGIDVLLEADPNGQRDPDALEKYPDASPGVA